ncbi:L,D-transpeptidase [Streptomyces sp. NPDC006879]|uniref:L,D-transpeptidase n=1 Tax=Streptomyces sp. NPDC006879 TaxID=3364767 RepID=UPI00367EE33F
MARSSSGFVAGLTAAALAVVGFLAYQASASAPEGLAGSQPAGARPSNSAAQTEVDPKSTRVPENSGTGERVVYSLTAKRVWLVGADGQAQRTFPVVPGTLNPGPGTYVVTSRSGSVTGSDGAPVEHVVRFASNSGLAIGFSARVDGATPAPDPGVKAGGIRMSRADGDAMWSFATVTSKVIVIP